MRSLSLLRGVKRLREAVEALKTGQEKREPRPGVEATVKPDLKDEHITV